MGKSKTHTVTQFRPNIFTLTVYNTVDVISSLRVLTYCEWRFLPLFSDSLWVPGDYALYEPRAPALGNTTSTSSSKSIWHIPVGR